jgi:hypothetical protein
MNEKTFKLGDRVECISSWQRGTRGRIIEIDDRAYEGRGNITILPDGNTRTITGYKDSWKFIESVSPSDTLTIGNKTYGKLKNLSPESVYKDKQACEDWECQFNVYTKHYSFFAEPLFDEVFIKFLQDVPKRLNWLISHGYIEEVKKKEKKVVVIENVNWRDTTEGVIPNASFGDGWSTFLNKPPMKMTLEWSE